MPARGVCPVHHSNCRSACAASIGSPSSTRQPCCACVAQQLRFARPVGQVVDQPPLEGPVGQRRLVAPPRTAKRRRVHQHVPRVRRAAATARPRSPASTPPREPAAARRACSVTTMPMRPQSRGHGTSRATGAQHRGAQLGRVHADGLAQRRQKAVHVGVGCVPPRRRSAAACWRRPPRWPRPRARRAARSASSLNGIVTLAPATPIASANARKSSKSSVWNGTYTASMPAARERLVVHHGRQRVHRRPAHHAEDARVRPHVPEPEIVDHPRRRHLAGRHAVARHRSSATRTAWPAVASDTPVSPMPITIGAALGADRRQRRQIAEPRRRHGHLDRARAHRTHRPHPVREVGGHLVERVPRQDHARRIARHEIGESSLPLDVHELGAQIERPAQDGAPLLLGPVEPPALERGAAGHDDRLPAPRQHRGHVEVARPRRGAPRPGRPSPRRRGRPAGRRGSRRSRSHTAGHLVIRRSSQTKAPLQPQG